MLREHLYLNEKSWLIAKGVKDYLILVGKLEFTFDEVQELIESWAPLNYVQDMQRYMLFHWKEYQDNKECYYKTKAQLQAIGKNCRIEAIQQYDIFESFGAYLLMDAMYKTIDFFKTGKFDLYMERVMAFDEWE